MLEKVNWYKDWFNSPFYHILYQNRDERDARELIDNLLEYFQPQPDCRFLDLACGKGRHAIYIADKGYETIGLDMSENSIKEASTFESDSLHFITGDMRNIPFEAYFDFVFNLFTSFGYFENKEDNIKTLLSVKRSLKPGGRFVLDFFNTQKILNDLVEKEQSTHNGIVFSIERNYSNGLITKKINFEYQNKQYEFEERVEALTLADFRVLYKEAGMEIKEVFGSYKLHPYHENESDRLIIIAE